MARKPMPWFRCYVEMCSDRKVRRLNPEHRWLWIVVLAMARQSPVRGALMVSERLPADLHDIADMAGMDGRSVSKGLSKMVTIGLLDLRGPTYWVPQWDARQYESDVSTERVRAFRERSRNGSETFQSRSRNGRGNAPETETESETDHHQRVTEGETHSDSPPDDDDDHTTVIHNHLRRWALANGKTNPVGYARSVIDNHATEFDGIDGVELIQALDDRWPLNPKPRNGTAPTGAVDLGDGDIFLPGTGIVSTGPAEHRLSDIAQAALRQLDA